LAVTGAKVIYYLRKPMTSRGHPKETVVFLGAGAGVADGLPSTNAVAEKVATFLAGRGVDRAFLLPASLDVLIGEPTGKNLMRLLADVWDLAQKTPDLAIHLYHFITIATQSAADLPKTGIQGFRKRLLEAALRRGNKLNVLTTNWDTSLDSIVFLIAGPEAAQIDFGMELDGRPKAEGDKATIRLYKLNGSADWFFCHACSIMQTARGIRIQRGLPENWKPSDFAVLCRGCKQLTERVIVVPTEGQARNPMAPRAVKAQASPIPLFRNASKVLENADEVLFVGYSLPDYDVAIRSLLRGALPKNKRILRGERIISVVAKEGRDGVTCRNFRDVLTERQFLFHGNGLEDFVQSYEAQV
jgi:hypothetical protein